MSYPLLSVAPARVYRSARHVFNALSRDYSPHGVLSTRVEAMQLENGDFLQTSYQYLKENNQAKCNFHNDTSIKQRAYLLAQELSCAIFIQLCVIAGALAPHLRRF